MQEFVKSVEQPLEICKDDTAGDFIKCTYNYDNDSYRSPWSNKFFPELEEPHYPANEFRELEIKFNKIFSLYKKLYYSNSAVSSVYIYDLGETIEQGFICCLLIKNCNIKMKTKALIKQKKYLKKEAWILLI